MRLLKQFAAVAVVAFAGSAAVGAVHGNTFLTLVFGLATAVLAVWTYAWVVRRTERRAPAEVGADGAPAAVGRGMAIGFAMFTAVIAAIAVCGGYGIDGFGSASGAIALIGFMAAAAVTEELLFRGVLFRIVEGRIGTWWALGLTGLVFGLSHLANPNASLWGALAIAVEAGGMLAAAYAATRTLWVPIGLHFAWNFAGAGLFGTDVSGKSEHAGLLDGATSGPMLLAGGDFGPEGSLFAVLAGVVLTVVFMRLARRRGNVVPRRRTGTPAPAATLAQ
ncbi:CAAX protease [Actinomadura sp. CNU-125]|uniref:CPBP family intramembrane glutamic endopeptidase n=1 Tax=Actinomadura sp. CNU-125 TaxID=1904961 RepID=UPI0009662521|nr:CPBP family intramembrane glutamic endopeptidase [Actinomadura sp. CNU-125]OLT27337.1 CAAX protease [Actinomadura sp. CNU-125]